MLGNKQADYGIALMNEWKRILEVEERGIFNATKSLGLLFEAFFFDFIDWSYHVFAILSLAAIT